MSQVPIPANAIGHVGMVASLRSINGEADVQSVVVGEAIGWVSQLLGATSRTFAWQVPILEAPAIVNSRPTCDFIVAKRHLLPIKPISTRRGEAHA